MQLSARRTKFVDEYILDHNGSRAARAAGYATSGARVTAHRLLTDANIITAIELKMHEMALQYEISKDRIINEILAAIDLANSKLDPSTMIRGWVEIGKLLGHYAPEVIELVGNTQNDVLKAKLEAMSDDELVAIVHSNAL
jgi:hypothetical protein